MNLPKREQCDVIPSRADDEDLSLAISAFANALAHDDEQRATFRESGEPSAGSLGALRQPRDDNS
jgi:hypothetical protein